ncbi:Ribonuclease 3 [Taenia crassiceps]|uniref:Ribonuclease 3 n=1 Tax=Taenia crassiceps TaxID=6207 RepID=A0ABR4QSM9_9CEST
MDPSHKKVIYITEKELASLPDGAPVYVLSSSNDSTKSQGPLLPTPSSTSFSNGDVPLSTWTSPSPSGCQYQPLNPLIPLSPLSFSALPQFVSDFRPPPLRFQYPPPPSNVPFFAPLPDRPILPPSVPSNRLIPNSTVSSLPRQTKSSCSLDADNSWRGEVVFQSVRCTPGADFFETKGICKFATQRMINLENDFENYVLRRREKALDGFPPVDVVRPPLKRLESVDIGHDDRSVLSKNVRKRLNAKKSGISSGPFAEVDSTAPDQPLNEISGNMNSVHQSEILQSHALDDKLGQQRVEVSHKLAHPHRLHPSIWHNEPGEYNSGPACSCKPKYRIGPLHNQFEGEVEVPGCQPESNNRDRLYHYRVMVTPTTNFFNHKPTVIPFNGNDYLFDGYSIFLHSPIDDLPPCQLLRFNLLYEFVHLKEEFPENFTVRALDMLTEYVFKELLELLDLNWRPHGVATGCPVVHLLPRFVRRLGSSAELLSANVILDYWMRQTQLPLIEASDLPTIRRMPNSEWSAHIDDLRGTLAWKPGAKPPAIRIDQLDRLSSYSSAPSSSTFSSSNVRLPTFPMLVHMTFTPMKLSLSRDPQYKSVLKNYLKLLYLMVNKPRISAEDRNQLAGLTNKLDSMDHSGVHRREITVELSCEGFYRTGIRPDVAQFALNMASFVTHVRCIMSLKSLETRLNYQFRDKSILHQALTHPSYRRTDFGTNQDHFQNTLTSCGPRTIEYGDKLQLYKKWRKKGLSKMIRVMSFMPKQHEERSKIYGNERLEFLGDAAIEIIASIHLFFMFPDLPEGNLDAYRQALVQNQHLADLALRLGLHKHLLYTHSVDFCHDSTYIYARSDAFEAVMAALALDGGLEVVDRIFGAVLFGDCERIHRVWVRIPPHPLQVEHPDGDREWVLKVPMFKKLVDLEERLGIHFKHLRVLARALTVRKTGYNIYTLGDNQRLEFLGDSLLKYVTTDYLYRHFPRHHEGHLSLLKNSLVNKYTQATVCSELGLDQFIIRREENSLTISSIPEEATASAARKQQNVKNKADLLEAFIGALYVDKDITWVERFCQVCFWPRLVEFILKQEWNDPKSKLQQCCLTFRSLNEDPELAHYKVLECAGPSNDREHKVGVYFRKDLLAVGVGRSVQSAEMDAAKNALEAHQDSFKQLDFQRAVIHKRYRQPYIAKMLNKLKSWDESLVDKFVGDVPEDGREGTDTAEFPSKRKRYESLKEGDEDSSVRKFTDSDMELEDGSP